jgi:hypothetical protein
VVQHGGHFAIRVPRLPLCVSPQMACHVISLVRSWSLSLGACLPKIWRGEFSLRRRDACSTCSGRRSGCWPEMVRSPAAPIPFW